MNRANEVQAATRESQRESAMVAFRRGMPSEASRQNAADEVAGDPAKLRLAGRLISWATTGNDVRFELVASLREAIEAGTYGIAASDFADKLIDGMRG